MSRDEDRSKRTNRCHPIKESLAGALQVDPGSADSRAKTKPGRRKRYADNKDRDDRHFSLRPGERSARSDPDN